MHYIDKPQHELLKEEGPKDMAEFFEFARVMAKNISERALSAAEVDNAKILQFQKSLLEKILLIEPRNRAFQLLENIMNFGDTNRYQKVDEGVIHKNWYPRSYVLPEVLSTPDGGMTNKAKLNEKGVVSHMQFRDHTMLFDLVQSGLVNPEEAYIFLMAFSQMDERNLCQFMKEHMGDNPNLSYKQVIMNGETVGFIKVHAFENVQSFSDITCPFIRENPDKSYMGFHDTSFYWAQKFAQEGIDCKQFGNFHHFYVHSHALLPYFLDKNSSTAERALYYAKRSSVTDSGQFAAPKEIRESDFRLARIWIIGPNSVFRDRDHSDKAGVVNNQQDLQYELIVKSDASAPKSSVVIGNVYHPLLAYREMGWNIRQDVLEQYRKFGINEESGRSFN